jgi:hypothetical protein
MSLEKLFVVLIHNFVVLLEELKLSDLCISERCVPLPAAKKP